MLTLFFTPGASSMVSVRSPARSTCLTFMVVASAEIGLNRAGFPGGSNS